MHRLRRSACVWLFASLVWGCARPQLPAAERAQAAREYAIEERSIAQLQADLAAGRVSSRALVAQYRARIQALDQNGPALRSVLTQNPEADAAAARLDQERAAGRIRGPLHGIPILVKDNIESADPMPTTAGSLALAHNLTGRDAPVVARLREAGAIVLGKTNLSEWANLRSLHSTSGWSALGGLTKNPYALERSPCGSSSGSGSAIAANLAAVALGTETDGSITCPASVTGLVGLKPTVGLVSRHRVIPISALQDTVGPMTRSVADAALVLSVIAGSDRDDPATAEADAHRSDYVAGLSKAALSGRRFGSLKFHTGYLPEVDALYAAAIAALEAAGAKVEVIDALDGLATLEGRELTVLVTDFRTGLNAYLATTPPAVTTRTLAELIAWNRAHAAEELRYFQQDLFERAEATAGHARPEYERLRDENRKAAAQALDQLLTSRKLDALIAPTTGPAWVSDLVNGDHILGSATLLPAVAGYPHLSVPMGQVAGLPVGLSLIGPAWSEAKLLALGYAYEQHTQHRRPPQLSAATHP